MAADRGKAGGRAAWAKAQTPQLSAELTLYPTEKGGRETAVAPGWGCPCSVSAAIEALFYDGWPQLGDEWMNPGETRRVGFVFPFTDAADILKAAGKFYLWEGRFIGEALVVGQDEPKAGRSSRARRSGTGE